MSELIAGLTAYPTVVFTVALGFVAAYWLLVIVGAVDLDGDGGHDGLLDALAAKGKVVGEALDGAAAKGEVVAGALENGASVEHPGLDDAGAAVAALNLRRAPITVTATFLTLFSWIVSFIAMRFLGPIASVALPSWLFGTMVLVGSVAAAIPLTSLATRPLEGLFRTTEGRKRDELVGSLCQVRTGRVDGGFGQAVLQDEGAELVLDVRVDARYGATPAMKRGDWAMIIGYDEERAAYLVEPYGEFEDGLESDDEERPMNAVRNGDSDA